MRTSIAVLASLATVALIAVAALPLTDGSSAVAAPTTTPAEDARTYAVDAVHSSIVFGIQHMNVAKFYGRFNEMSGTINWNPESPDENSLHIEIKAESIDTNNSNRDDHLRSPDFFNVREFPTIAFKSTKIEKRGDTYRATGDLTLHGVEREITLDLKQTGEAAHPRSGKHVIGLESHFTIQRSKHRMNYGIEQNALSDEVKLIVSIEAVEQ